MNQSEQQKQLEAETQAYKQFMKVAKRVSNLQYGKWKIVPNVNDPLRKFTLEKEIGWATVIYSLSMEQFYHRADYTENRYGYRAKLVVSGLFVRRDSITGVISPLYANMGMRLKPRMAKKLILATDDVITPQFYEVVMNEDKRINEQRLQTHAFREQLKKLQGLKVNKKKNYYNSDQAEYQGTIKNCPFVINLKSSTVELEGSLLYDEFAVIVNRMGWGL